MAHQVKWTQIFLDEFFRLGALTDFEKEVMRTRVAGWTRTKQCQKFSCSESTLDRTIHELKEKYDICQKYSDILPPRKFSKKEQYMDTH